MKPEGFPRRLRLRRRREFLRVQNQGEKLHTRHFLVFVSPVDADRSRAALTRIGVTVTRKVGPAVVRNRIKRLVREAFRRHREEVPQGLEVVFVAKRNASSVCYEDVVTAVRIIGRRIGSPEEIGTR